MTIYELSDQQKNILSGILTLRKINSPLVQGVSLLQEDQSAYIKAWRTIRSKKSFVPPLLRYFEEIDTSHNAVCFDEASGDIAIMFGRKTLVQFTRDFDKDKDISTAALVGRPLCV